MFGYNQALLKTLGEDVFAIGGSFQTNAAANPVSTTFRSSRGVTFTVTYAATGIYTVQLASNLDIPAQPLYIGAKPQAATLATDWFECFVVGETTLTTSATPSFVIQAHRNGVANAPAATAGNRINWLYVFQQTTGK